MIDLNIYLILNQEMGLICLFNGLYLIHNIIHFRFILLIALMDIYFVDLIVFI